MRAPDDAHASTTTSLDAGNRVLEDKAFLGGDRCLAGGERVVDGLEREEENVGQRLATARSQTSVVSENAALRRENGEELLEVVGLDTEIAQVRAGGEGDVNALGLAVGVGLVGFVSSGAILDLPVSSAAKVSEKVGDAGKRFRVRKQLLLQGRVLGEVLLRSDGELGPVVEDLVGGGTWAALELGLDGPGKGTFAILFENHVNALRVDVLGVEEKAVHVEETGPNGREAVRFMVSKLPRWLGKQEGDEDILSSWSHCEKSAATKYAIRY